MIIINTKGGLGNQMFQYALYLTMLNAGKDVRICTEHFDWAISENRNLIQQHGKKFLIEDIFNTKGIRATSKEVDGLSTSRMDFLSRLLKKMGFEKKSHLFEEKMRDLTIDQLLALDNVFLDGYWQRFDYFEFADEIIRREYTFSYPLTSKNLEIAKKILCGESVSIHVRRNDYLNTPLYVLQNEEYYQKAIEMVINKLKFPEFYCFSDDPMWCKKHLSKYRYKFVFVDWNLRENSYRDMQLMSLCKANIITNSTFSMWAAWLNVRKDKIVIRPEHYYTDLTIDQKFYWPSQWIKV